MHARRGVPQSDDLPGMRIRQGFQQHAFDHAENRRAGANAQRQRKYAGRRETGVAAQPASGIAQIRKRRRDRVFPSIGAHLFANCGSIAQFNRAARRASSGERPLASSAAVGLLQIAFHFVGNVLVGGSAVRESAQAAGKIDAKGTCG